MGSLRPNLIFVFADQLRGFDLACAGNPQVATPHLDRLAAEGIRFDRAFANSPVCTPSRGTILTGQLPLDHGAVVNDVPLGDAPTIAELLAASGYHTGYIGKWHLDGVPRDRFTPPGPRRHGFDYWAAYNCSHDYYRTYKYFLDDPEPVAVEGYEPHVQTDLAVSFLRRQRSGPFALYLSWGPPHDPYDQVPDEYRQLYAADAVTHRPNVRRPAAGPDPDRTLADYFAAITALDEQMGRILEVVRETGHDHDTIVVFTADHGDMLWSHGMVKKQQPWEESIRIPLIVRWPGVIPAGRVSDVVVSTVDYVPTLLGLMNIDHQPDFAGRDLSHILAGEAPDARTLAHGVPLMNIVPVDAGARQGIPEWRGVRTAQYTYVEQLGRVPWLLYDNDADPYQLTNLVGHDDHAEVQRELHNELTEWLNEADDPFVSGLEHLRLLDLTDAWDERQRDQGHATGLPSRDAG